MNPLIRSIIFYGLIVLVWFTAIARGAYDVWAATTLFASLTLLTALFCFAHARRADPVELFLPLKGPLLLFLTGAGVSGWHSFDHDAFRQEMWGCFFVVVAFYLFVNVATDESQRRRFFFGSSLVVCPIALVCVWQQLTGHPSNYGHFHGLTYGHWEIPGTLLNSIVLAGFLLYWPVLWWTRRRDIKGVWITIASGGLILLLARSAWADVCLGIGMLWFYRPEVMLLARRHRAIFGIAALLAVALLAALIWFKTARPAEESSYQVSSRWVYWATAFRTWKHQPCTGIGLGGFPVAFLYFKAGPAQSTLFTHSAFLQWLAETGLFGVGTGILLCIAVFYYRRSDTQDEGRLYSSTLLAVGLFSAININMEYTVNRLVWLLMAGAWLDRDRFQPVRSKRLWIVVSGLGLLLVSPFWASDYVASRLMVSGARLEQQGYPLQAIKCYQDALALDHANAESAEGVSRLLWMYYQHSHDPRVLHESQFYLNEAIRQKHDVRLIQQLARYPDAS